MGNKVSVIVPVYNAEKYIDQCVESIINQTLSEIEIILIDDGSKDGSGSILDSFVERDSRIHVIHKENSGVSDARNDGIAESAGEYIYIMDSDDYLEPDALEVMYDCAIDTCSDVVITDYYIFNEGEEQVPHVFFSEEFVSDDQAVIFQLQNMTLYRGYSPYYTSKNTGVGIAAPWTKLIKRRIIVENNLKFDSYVKGIFDDGLFTLAVFQFAKKVSYIAKRTYHYRVLKSSLIHGFNPKRPDINARVFQRIDEFGEKYQKDEEFYMSLYARIISYMLTSFHVYYFNVKNECSAKDNYREFKSMMLSEPYRTAIREVDLNKLDKREKQIVILGRINLNSFIWVVYWIRHKIKRRKV